MSTSVQVTGDGGLRVETLPAVALTEALAGWQREARHGVCETDRYRCRYFVWGSGPPLVFIHGLCDVARSFVPVMEPLRRHFTCVAYEMPDGGPDGARLGAIRHNHLIADLIALLDHLRFCTVDLFASSFGSTVGFAALAAQPGRFRRVVVQGGVAYRPMAAWERGLAAFLRYRPGPIGTLPLRGRINFHPSDLSVFRERPPELLRFARENTNAPSMAAVARRALMLPHLDLRPKLSAIRQTVLMLCGDRDPIVPPECEPPLLEGLPNVERVEFPFCGHYPQYTHTPLVAELTKQFLHAPDCLTDGCAHH